MPVLYEEHETEGSRGAAWDDGEGLLHAPRPVIWISPVFDGTVVIRVRGEIDIVGAADLRSVLNDQRDDGHNVLLDLGKVEMIDASAIRMLLDAVRDFSLDGLRLKLFRSLRPQVRRLLTLHGTAELFQTH